MRCLVTGSAGFIGSHLVDRLIDEGHYVVGMDNLSTGRRENCKHLTGNKRFEFVNDDVAMLRKEKIFKEGFDWIFHLAGKADLIPSIENPGEYHRVNVNGTFMILQMARNFGCKKFIYAASSTCYGIPENFPTSEVDECHPEHPYGLTKYVGEQYVLHYGQVYKLPVVSLRLFNVYGMRARTSGTYGAVFGVFLSQIANKKPLTVVGDGTQRRDFTHVSDVVEAFVKAAESNHTGIFNVGSGNPHSINELIRLMGGVEIESLPWRPGEPKITYADTKKIYRLLRWVPQMKFEDGVRAMLRNLDIWKDAPLWDKESIKRATKDWMRYLS